jgi:hypothetical protein
MAGESAAGKPVSRWQALRRFRARGALLYATLSKPFLPEALLAAAENIPRVTDSMQEEIMPLPIWRSQPSADGLCLR